MNLLELLKQELFKIYLKINYYKICEELKISKHYTKIIKNKYSFYLFDIQYVFVKNSNNFKDCILHIYINILFEELRIESEEFESYMNKHICNIEILNSLLHDRNYEYNAFLFENLFLLKESLNCLYFQLDSINNLSISDNIKIIEIKKQIYKKFDSFFCIVNKLNLRRCC